MYPSLKQNNNPSASYKK